MELGRIVEFLNNKSILVIGASGFLAKSIVSSPKQFLSSRLANLIVISSLYFLFSNVGSFCGEDIEGSTRSEEALSSSKSHGH